MTTQSQYTPEVVQLQGGLDLVTPRPNVAPGALIDCMNYEVTDVLGYSRVLGVDRFDGRAPASNAYSNLYTAVITQCVAVPQNITATAVTTGGTVPANKYYIVVTAVNANGETTASTQIQVATTTATSSINVSATGSSGAASFNWYIGTTPGVYPYIFTSASSTTTITSLGSAATSPPTINTAALPSGNVSVPDVLYLQGDTAQTPFATLTDAVNIPGSIGQVTLTFYVTDPSKFYPIYANASSGTGVILTSKALGNTYLRVNSVENVYNQNNLSLSACIGSILANYTTIYNSVTPLGTTNTNNTTVTYNPVTGMVWYKEQLYCIADLNSFAFNSGSTQIFVGDVLGSAITVRDITVTAGDWASGSAQGVIWYSPVFVNSGNYSNIGDNNAATIPFSVEFPPGSSVDVDRGATTILNAITVAGFNIPNTPTATKSGLYRSCGMSQLTDSVPIWGSQGWQEIDMGYTAQFKSGTSSGPPTLPGRSNTPTQSQLTNTAPAQCTLAANSTSQGGAVDTNGANGWHTGTGTWTNTFNLWPTAIQQAAAFTANGGSGTFSGNWVQSPSTIPSNPGNIDLTGFTFPDLPDDVLINGIEIGLAAAHKSGDPSAPTIKAQLMMGGATVGTFKSALCTSNSPTAPTQQVFGGANDFWGTTGITVAQLKDPSFCVRVILASQTQAGGTGYLCGMYVKVYYQTSSSVYYFWDGTQDVSAVVVNTYVSSGGWTTNDAAGTIHVVGLYTTGTSSKVSILPNDQLRTAPSGGGNLIATITSSMQYAGLPSLSQLQANGSQYEIITSNFYGNSTWEAIYGVSGAGQAWTWDGFYFRYINTGLDPTLDKPRHIAAFNFHLCLGYNTGTVISSVAGEPENFGGALGAAEFDTGDPVMGLLRMNGTTLGIFCKKSIVGLVGTDNTNFSLNILSPYEGAIEYTVVDCGKPVYTSHKGISTFDQASSYGNFLGTRLTYLITPFLLPRLSHTYQGANIIANVPNQPSIVPRAIDPSVMFAMPIRDRNQYRLWFKDGYYITLTFSGTDMSTTSTTLQRIDFSSNETDILVPLAHTSSIDDNGLERNFVSYYNPARGLPTTSTSNRAYVWELNRGWGFGTSPIKGWFTTTHNFFQNPFQIANIRKIRLHGQSQGAGSLQVAVSSDYLSKDFPYGYLYGQTQTNAPAQDISLPRDWNSPTVSAATWTPQYQSETNIANVAKKGRSFSMQFATNPSTIEPPTVAQSLLMTITEDKADI